MAHLDIKHLNKIFDDEREKQRPAVIDFSLDVNEGEFISLIGSSGCGKTTVLRMVAGLVHPTSGSISLDGRDITWLPPEKREAAMVFQHYALFPHMDVFNNVAFGLRYKRGFKKADIKPRVENMLAMVGLRDLAERLPANLSGGQQQRVALARALVTSPKVLLCDEPLCNLDADLRKEMRVEIKRIHKEIGSTTIYVTHDRDEAEALADRMITMKEGRIVDETAIK